MIPRPVEKRLPKALVIYRTGVPVVLFIWLWLLIGIARTSVSPASYLASGNCFGVPSRLGFDNFLSACTETPILRYMLNSLLITVPTVVGALVLSSIAGLALAMYRFRLNVVLFVPFQILMVPVRKLTLQTGFCTLFMRNFIKALPARLFKSVRVKGVKEWRIFVYIVVPLVRPAIAALSVLVFAFLWNGYFWASVLAQSVDAMPITAGPQALQGQWVAAWHLIAAGLIVAAISPARMFLVVQRHFIAGLTPGPTKG